MNTKKNYLVSKKYINPNVSYGFFTRQGGFSFKKFDSLNCSFNNEDQNIAVKKNILQAQKNLLLDKKKLKFVSQIHSNRSIIINNKNYLTKFHADGIITQDKNISIAILTADCCPIFLFDDENKFISCIHVGWKGACNNIIKNSVYQISKIQSNLNSVKAIIGPCLKKKNFEVSFDFKVNFLNINSKFKDFFSTNNKKIFFDMNNLIKFQLIENNIVNIDDVDIDTYDNEDLFFSHRRSTHLNQIPTGRMINIIGFNS